MANNSYWLMKTEPNVFSFDDLKASEGMTTCWDGIRNYQARNYMMNDMLVGDLVLFYHSNCKVPGVVGISYVSSGAYVDYTAHDSSSKYYDPKSTKEKPRWYMVDLTYKADFKRFVSLKEIKSRDELSGMKLVQRGVRLSIQPVLEEEFNIICKMGGVPRGF